MRHGLFLKFTAILLSMAMISGTFHLSAFAEASENAAEETLTAETDGAVTEENTEAQETVPEKTEEDPVETSTEEALEEHEEAVQEEVVDVAVSGNEVPEPAPDEETMAVSENEAPAAASENEVTVSENRAVSDSGREETGLVDKELVAEADGHKITAAGNMPENAELLAKKISYTETKEIEDSLNEEGCHTTITVYDAFDIEIRSEGEVWQPVEHGSEVKIRIEGLESTIGEIEEKRSAAEETQEGFVDVGLRVTRLDNETGEATELPVTNDEGSIEFDTEHFTVFTVNGETYDTSNATESWDISAAGNGSVMAYWYADTGKLVINGSGATKTYKGSGTGVSPIASNLSSETFDVEMSDGITNIGEYLFYHCENMTVSSLSTDLTDIGRSAFEGCTALTDLPLPDGLESIGSNTFNRCSNLALTGLPSNLRTIGGSAFRGCSSLTLCELPSGLTTLQSYAFNNCYNITLTGLPYGITQIYNRAFMGCTGLTRLDLHEGITEIASSAFEGCTGLEEVNIPASVSNIGGSAFKDCYSLKEITYAGSSGPATMGWKPFLVEGDYNSSNLLPTVLRTESSSLIAYDWAGSNRQPGYSVTFMRCDNPGYTGLFKEVVAPGTDISALHQNYVWYTDETFSEVADLSNITANMTVYTDHAATFTIDGKEYDPQSASLMGEWDVSAEQDGSMVAYAFFDDTLGGYELVINKSGGSGTMQDYDDSTTPPYDSFPGMYEYRRIVMSDGIRHIGDYAFRNASSIGEIRFPLDLEEIGQYAFYYSAMSSVNLPSSLVSIGDSAFYGNPHLFAITGGDVVTTIGAQAFWADYQTMTRLVTGSSALAGYDWASDNRQIVSNGLVVNGHLYDLDRLTASWDVSAAEDGSVMAYYFADYPDEWGNVNTKLIIYGDGEPKDYNSVHEVPYFLYGEEEKVGDDQYINTVIMDNRITAIGSYSLSGLTQCLIWSGFEGIKDIHAHAFEGSYFESYSLSLDARNSIETIGESAFRGCGSITIITFQNVTSVGNEAFYVEPWSDGGLETVLLVDNEALNSYDWAGSNRAVLFPTTWQNDYIYEESNGIMLKRYIGSDTEITVPSFAVTSGGKVSVCLQCDTVYTNGSEYCGWDPGEGWTAVQGVYSSLPITSITVEEGVGCTNADHMFDGCTSLVSAELSGMICRYNEVWDSNTGDQVKEPFSSDYMFNGCSSLTYVGVPGLTDIGEHCFDGCTALPSEFNIPEKVISIGDVAFNGDSNITAFTGDAVFLKDIGNNAFYVPSEVATTVTTKSQLIRDYDWASDNRSPSTSYDDATVTINGRDYNLSNADEWWDVSMEEDGSIIAFRIGTDLVLTGTGQQPKAYPNAESREWDSDWSPFYDNSTITNIAVQDGLSYIGQNIFEKMNVLESVYVGGTTYIGAQAFKDCTALTDITFADDVCYVYDSAFAGCTGITELTFPGAQSLDISENAFNGCTGLQKLVFLEGKESSYCTIGSYAFSGCDSLTNIVFEKYSGESFGSNAFWVNDTVDTTVTLAENSSAEWYDWAADNRNVTFVGGEIKPPYSITLPAVITECKGPDVQHAEIGFGQYGKYIIDVPVHLEMGDMNRHSIEIQTAGGRFGDGFLTSPGYYGGMVSADWYVQDEGWRHYTEEEIEADPEGVLEDLFENNKLRNISGGYTFYTNTDWLPETVEKEVWSESAGELVSQQCTLTRFPVNISAYKDVSPAADELSDSVFRSEYWSPEQINDYNENGYQRMGGATQRFIVPDGEIDFDLQLMVCKKELYRDDNGGGYAIQGDGETILLAPYTETDPLPIGSYSGSVEVAWNSVYESDDGSQWSQ